MRSRSDRYVLTSRFSAGRGSNSTAASATRLRGGPGSFEFIHELIESRVGSIIEFKLVRPGRGYCRWTLPLDWRYQHLVQASDESAQSVDVVIWKVRPIGDPYRTVLE
jgi:hypothetical protein